MGYAVSSSSFLVIGFVTNYFDVVPLRTNGRKLHSSSRDSAVVYQVQHCPYRPPPEQRDGMLRLAADSPPRTPSEAAPLSPRFNAGTMKPYPLVE